MYHLSPLTTVELWLLLAVVQHIHRLLASIANTQGLYYRLPRLCTIHFYCQNDCLYVALKTNRLFLLKTEILAQCLHDSVMCLKLACMLQ